jgi:V8-like Glu-specific endopeptidase
MCRFRFICSVKDARTDSHYCGCALIAPNVALTAAHCVAQSDVAMRNPIIEVGASPTAASVVTCKQIRPGTDADLLPLQATT